MEQKTNSILQEVGKVVIGKEQVIAKVLMAVLASGHVLMEDVPGVGKTTLAITFAKVLGLSTRRVQFTSDTMPSDVIGFSIFDRERQNFVYKPGAVMTNLLLADEINRTSSKTQSALLEAMEEHHVTVDGVTYDLPKPFLVLATQNPVGSAGTQMLPSSQLDRFLIRLSMGYPDLNNQVDIMRDRHTQNPLDRVSPVTNGQELQEMIAQAAAVNVADAVYAYIAGLAQATREHPMVQLGISPRGALALCRMAKALAYVEQRDYVTPEDVVAVAGDVWGHRLLLNTRGRMIEETTGHVLQEVLARVPMPALRSL